MPYRICKSIEVENGHMLSKHPDKCQFPHGHTRKVEIVMESSELDENQMVCDFKIIKAALGEWLDRFDHALCMNTDDPAYPDFKERYGDRVIGFDHQDPTTELMARTIFDHATTALASYAATPDMGRDRPQQWLWRWRLGDSRTFLRPSDYQRVLGSVAAQEEELTF